MAQLLTNIRQQFESLTKKPEDYLSVQDIAAGKVSALLKSVYDLTKSEEKQSNGEALPELIVDGFDEEQIWQELELQNANCGDDLVRDVAKIVSLKKHLSFPVASSNIDHEAKDVNVHNEENLHNEEEKEDSDSDSALEKEGEAKPNDDLESNMGQSNEEDDDDGSSGDDNDMFFQDIPNDEDLFYSDVFGKEPPEKSNETLMEAEDNDDGDYEEMEAADNDDGDYEENNYNRQNAGEALNKGEKQVRFDLQNETKSSLEQRQERLKAKIEQLEEAALAEKPWQLKGEISATARPQNSLLEEVLEFDLTTRPPPVITEKTTQKLEDVILQRIKDKAWDDVERKIKPVETPSEYKKKLVLDQEKSKLSLAEIYEKEYLKEREKALGDGEPKENEEPPEYQQIRSMMSSLFAKLDALSNFHYTPKPPAPEVKIVSNLPAITMEEVAPVATSDAALLAPEEVKARPKGDIKGKEERTKTDKKRERRLKKARQRAKQHEREKRELALQKQQSAPGKKYSKLQASHDVKKLTRNTNISQMEVKGDLRKAVKSSAAFFNRLQDEVRSHIKAQTKTKEVDKRKALSAKKIKL